MSNFREYAEFYDDLNNKKDYGQELSFIIQNISQNNRDRVLDLGSGSGILYPELSRVFRTYYGVDISPEFVALSTKRYGDNFCCDDIRQFIQTEKSDLILSLFHVINYMKDLNELESVFKNVIEMLRDESSFFVFDSWHKEAVENLGLKETKRVYRSKDTYIERTATSSFIENKKRVSVMFNFKGFRGSKGIDFSEEHKMRPFSFEEIKLTADKVGLKISSFNSFPDTSRLVGIETWGVIYFLQKR